MTQLLAATDGRGADLILDVVGGKYLQRNVSVLADGGRLVIIGMQGGRAAELDIAALMSKRAAIVGTMLRSRPATGLGSKAEVVAAVRAGLWPLNAAGTCGRWWVRCCRSPRPRKRIAGWPPAMSSARSYWRSVNRCVGWTGRDQPEGIRAPKETHDDRTE